jgi:endoglycosylceramidase
MPGIKSHHALTALATALLVAGCESSDPLRCATPSPLPTAPTALHVEGRWLVDEQGRVVTLHGVNMVNKIQASGYRPSTLGFGDDDAAYIVSQGFNTVRTGLIHKGYALAPGQYDAAYLADIAGTVKMLTDHGLYVLFDFHQDMFNERYQGEGLADWMAFDSAPTAPTDSPNCQAGFPGNMFSCNYLWEAFDNFLGINNHAPVEGPRGLTLQQEFAEAWQPVAAKLRDDPLVFGYNLFNEPHPGSALGACFSPSGCPADLDPKLTAFHQRVADAVRAIDPDKSVWYEPYATNFNGSLPTNHGDLAAGDVGFSFHNYACPATVPGVPAPPGTGASDECDTISEQRVFDNAEAQSARYGHALLMTEYGATDDIATIDRLAGLADTNRVGWQYWAWWNEDPCCERPNEGLIDHPSNPPTPEHLREDKLDVLVRAYPRAVAGTPLSWSWDRAQGRFTLSYTAAAVGASPLAAGAVTQVWLPARHFPRGYRAVIAGGQAISRPGAEDMQIVACDGAGEVSVTVTAPE